MTDTGLSQEDRSIPVRELHLLRQGNHWRARISVVEHGTTRMILKDYSCATPLFRRILGAWLARREARAYRQLVGVSGIPRFYGMWGRDGILIEEVDGENALSGRSVDVDDRFFQDLHVLLASIRDAGVIHFDLPGNVIILNLGQPVVLDFQASMVISGWPRFIRTRIERIARDHNEFEILKLKERIRPLMLSSPEKDMIHRGPRFGRTVSLVIAAYRFCISITLLFFTGRWHKKKPIGNSLP